MVFSRTIKVIQEFIKLESACGILLIIAALLALLLANSPLSTYYQASQNALIICVNEGLMTLFFLLVGLEIKREIVSGELDTFKKLALPVIAAIGGMVIPALIYLFITSSDSVAFNGWAIPIATDIAFALGILGLFGSRIPFALKVFLTALAIIDDIGAIIVIAVYYTHTLFYLPLCLALLVFISLISINLCRVRRLTPYLLLGVVLWILVFQSGVHATLAGVALALTIPIEKRQSKQGISKLEQLLHPWVAYLILPIFAFFNAGLNLSNVVNIALTPISIGICLGLFLGKQIGVFGAVWCAVKLGFAKLPKEVDWQWLYGISIICGIGFTMSFFIGVLAFNSFDSNYLDTLRFGVLMGSILSACFGSLVLYLKSRRVQII